MSIRTESVTLNLVSLALDAASLRHQAIASNISNGKTEGYRPLRVSFEDQLENVRRELKVGYSPSFSNIRNVKPILYSIDAEQGQQISELDLQAAELAKNALQYQALLKGLNKHFSIISSIINEGKR